MSGTIKLLSTSRPKADENLFGYIIRLTERNGYDTPSWILNSARLNDQQLCQTGALLFKSHQNLKILAQLARVNLSDLVPLTYPRVTAPISTPLHLFFGASLPQCVIRARYPQICPKCLLETGHCHRIWDLIFVTTCPVHRCMLIDVCPNCDSRITWLRNSVSICRCKFDWKFYYQPVKESELKVVQQIYRLCGVSTSGWDKIYLKNNNPLIDLDLQGFVQAMLVIITRYTGLLGSKRGKLRGKPTSQLHPLIVNAFSIFENWPDQFYLFFDWCRHGERDLASVPRELKATRRRGTNEIGESFYKGFSASQFDFLREAINQALHKINILHIY